MKFLQRTTLVVLAIFSVLAASAQQDSTASFKVFGACEQCRQRIEKSLAIKGIQGEPGVSELHYESNPMPQTEIQGIMQEGSYLYKNAVKLSFYNLIMVRGQHRWLVSIRYRTDDNNGQEVAKRVFNSVKVKPLIVKR